jgi:hypothetical protein
MFVLFFETGWLHGRGLVFREPRILILPCHAASMLSTEHPFVIHATAKKNSVAWKRPVNAVKELLELQNETDSGTLAHSTAVLDTNAEINNARWLRKGVCGGHEKVVQLLLDGSANINRIAFL